MCLYICQEKIFKIQTKEILLGESETQILSADLQQHGRLGLKHFVWKPGNLVLGLVPKILSWASYFCPGHEQNIIQDRNVKQYV